MLRRVPEDDSQITVFLQQMRDGDAEAADRMLPLVYDRLRGLAAQRVLMGLRCLGNTL